MQSTALSSSLPLLKPLKTPSPSSSLRTNPTFPSSFNPLSFSSARPTSTTLKCSNPNNNSNNYLFPKVPSHTPSPFDGVVSKNNSDGLVVPKATSVPESADSGDVAAAAAAAKSSAFAKTVELGILFAMWYLFNIYFNIYNKQVLKAFHYPFTVTLVQFAVGTALVLFMWTFNLYKRPKISAGQLLAIAPLAIVHTLGNLFTNMSLGKVAVSFTHTIKAMEPFFSVLLSAMFLGESPTPWVALSLLPIVGGVALASISEVSFNWAGFWSAMASNVTNQSRNVLSKKLMVKKEESMDNITLFSIITIMSLFMLAPFTYLREGVKFTPTYLEAAGLNVQQMYTRSLLAALCFHAYQQVSYMILQRVSPVTHSVGNCVKRVVVIVSSVFFFKTPVSPVNAIGTGIALAGVFAYSRVKSIKAKPKAA